VRGDRSEGLTLVGGSLLKHWFSVWDVGKQRMGFAPAGKLLGCAEKAGILIQYISDIGVK
jgi:hypothetical protein